jgi:3-oxoadipate enol-lactonase
MTEWREIAQMMEVRPGVTLAYDDECFRAPWQEPVAVMLVHGVAESAMAWRQWLPHLGADYRVVRPDMAGHGRSPVPDRYTWRTAEVAADYLRLADALGIKRFHLVGAKYGGSIAMQMAADFPERVLALARFGAPAHGHGLKANFAAVPGIIREIGVAGWAERTQKSRLGPDAPPAQLDWWTHGLMGRTDERAAIGAAAAAAEMDVQSRLGDISVETLVVTTEDSPLQPIATAEAYQRAIPRSRLKVLPGDCYHIAAVRPAECAAAWKAFAAEID